MAASELGEFESYSDAPLTEKQMNYLAALIDMRDVVSGRESLHPVAEVIQKYGPEIRDSIAESSPDRQNAHKGLLHLIDAVHPEN